MAITDKITVNITGHGQYQTDVNHFTVVTEFTDAKDYASPDAVWERRTRTYDTEREAVGAWESARQFVNTRPVSIDPEPDWSRYSYDGKTPISKW